MSEHIQKLVRDLREIASADEGAIGAIKYAAAELDRLADLCAQQQAEVARWSEAWLRCRNVLVESHKERDAAKNELAAAVEHAKRLVEERGKLRDEVARLRKAYDGEFAARNTVAQERDGARRRIAELSAERDALRDERDRLVKSPLRQELATMTADRDALAEGVRAYREALKPTGTLTGLPCEPTDPAIRAWERKHGHRADQKHEPAPTPPPLLDLRTLPVGTVCEAVEPMTTALAGFKPTGVFTIMEQDEGTTYPTKIKTAQNVTIWLCAKQPARVIPTPKPEEPYRAGLPALAMRRACREWDKDNGSRLVFDNDERTWRYELLVGRPNPDAIKWVINDLFNDKIRPHARTWTEVEHDAARLLGSEHKSIQVSPICSEADCLNWLSLKLGITDARDMASLWAAFREGQKS